MHRLKIVLGGGALVRGHEVSDELMAQVLHEVMDS
jgi:hypothetical protein